MRRRRERPDAQEAGSAARGGSEKGAHISFSLCLHSAKSVPGPEMFEEGGRAHKAGTQFHRTIHAKRHEAAMIADSVKTRYDIMVAVKQDSLSILILARDEERDLPRCLAALEDFGEIVVVDSGSTDGTQAIARAAGARVFENPFQSFGQQRNWALDHCGVTSEWVLFLDADEVATPNFREAVRAAIRSADRSVAGFYCCWKTMLGECWLRRSDSFPKWQFRVLRRGRARFIDSGHGQKEGEIQGELGYIREPYLHYAFSKGWEAWWAKHEKYAEREAIDRAARAVSWRELLSRDPSRRNRALKPIVSRLPGWPLLRFLHMYLAKGGFREGRPALIYCRNMARYEALIRAEMARRSGAKIPRCREFSRKE